MVQTTQWRSLVRRGRETTLVTLEVGEVAPGEVLTAGSADEELIVVEGGRIAVVLGDRDLASLGNRRTPFEGPGDALYLPPGAEASLRAEVEGARLVRAAAPPPDGPGHDGSGSVRKGLVPRVIRPADQRIADVGRENWRRQVRTILGPEHEALRLLAGETLNPPGNWSSYPPHKHDVDAPPLETRLEEVYLFRVDPPGGFGVQVRYHGDLDGGSDRSATVVVDGDVAAIPSGYHPVVAAPGYRLYYLWVMAGVGRAMHPHLDPRHAWVDDPGAAPPTGGPGDGGRPGGAQASVDRAGR